jgi:hypothetical protein
MKFKKYLNNLSFPLTLFSLFALYLVSPAGGNGGVYGQRYRSSWGSGKGSKFYSETLHV